MRAVVFRGKNKLRVEDVREPSLEGPRDAIIRVSLTTICGTDIHLVNGRIPGMVRGTTIGHECVGVVEEVGDEIDTLSKGDRVVVLSTIGCGFCASCVSGHFAHCERTPVSPETYFFGGPASAGSLDGMQAELVRVPYADVGCISIPDELDDLAALALSDIFPTAFFAARSAGLGREHRVVILGAGPVGQLAVISARMNEVEKILVVDREPARLELVRRFPEVATIDFSTEDVASRAIELLGSPLGADAVIDCVGLEAVSSWGFHSPAKPIEIAAQVVRPDGVYSVVGLYPPSLKIPFGELLEKNVRIVGGNCHHRSHVDAPLEYATEHADELRAVFTHRASLEETPAAYEQFVAKRSGMVKCALIPEGAEAVLPASSGRALARVG